MRPFMRSALEQVWKSKFWPRLMRIRGVDTLPGTGSADVSDDSVYFYQRDYGTPGANAISGSVKRVYDIDPRQRIRGIRELKFRPDGEIIEILHSTESSVFVQYRIAPPLWDGLPFDSEATYSEGDVVLFGEGDAANFYMATAAIDEGVPIEDEAEWAPQSIPAWIATVVARYAFADFVQINRDDEVYQRAVNQARRALEITFGIEHQPNLVT